jgi:hypothetical protein
VDSAGLAPPQQKEDFPVKIVARSRLLFESVFSETNRGASHLLPWRVPVTPAVPFPRGSSSKARRWSDAFLASSRSADSAARQNIHDPKSVQISKPLSSIALSEHFSVLNQGGTIS